MNTKHQIELSPWHKTQAGMLHYFASQEYLIQLHRLVTQLIDGNVNPLLEIAKKQGRDALLANALWGERNTSINWANNAWPMLKELQASIAKKIAARPSEQFRQTSVYHCIRGLEEYSMEWTTPAEENTIRLALDVFFTFASKYDKSVTLFQNRWDDFIFAYHYHDFASTRETIPKFVLRSDIRGVTGQLPPQTGIYKSADDPHASLQFVWTKNGGAQLRVANTFNDIGIAALHEVGRKDLWFDEIKMLNFAISGLYPESFANQVLDGGRPSPKLAPAAIARSAFTKRSCEWMLVDIVPGKFEELPSLDATDQRHETPFRTAVPAGKVCTESGFYFSPAISKSCRFMTPGQIFPAAEAQ